MALSTHPTRLVCVCVWGLPSPQSEVWLLLWEQECLPSLEQPTVKEGAPPQPWLYPQILPLKFVKSTLGCSPVTRGVDIRVVELQALQEGNGPILASSL